MNDELNIQSVLDVPAEEIEMKQCRRKSCRQFKPISEFQKTKSNNELHQSCKSCRKFISGSGYQKAKERKKTMVYDEDESKLKQCSHKDCLKFKHVSLFTKNILYADGYKSWCKECDRNYIKSWRIKQLELHPRPERAVRQIGENGRTGTKHKILEPRTTPFEENIQDIIARELRQIKRERSYTGISVIKGFSLDKLLKLRLIDRSYSISPYFMGIRVRDPYTLPPDDEFIRLDDYCYGEPPSSFKEFIRLTDPDKSFDEMMATILENISELSQVA